MKFSIEREIFVNILTDFTSILKDNPIKPIIACLKIEVKDGKITFIGTNLEATFIKSVDGKIEDEGTVIIKPQLILEYIKLLDIKEIVVSLENNNLKIHQAEFMIYSEDEGYPHIEKIDAPKVTKIGSDILIDSLEKCRFSASQFMENLALNCVRVLFRNNYTEFVSTDSYRLTYLKKDVPCMEEKEVSIPLESVVSLTKLLKDVNSEVTIGMKEQYLIILWENSYFSTRIIELPFPNFQGLLTYDSFGKVMEFNSNEFKSALKKVMTVAKTSYETKYGAIFDFKNKTLVMKSSSGKGKITQKVNMIKDGDDFKGSLNTKFLIEFLNNVSKNIIVKGNDASSMFEISEEGNENYKYILMPLALRE